MSKQDNGGSAFPLHARDDTGRLVSDIPGMTLRDYFAAKALAGMIADPKATCGFDAFAADAYRYADAMLKARESK